MDDDKPDSPTAIDEMRKRHLVLGIQMQAVAAAALRELQEKAAQGRLDMTLSDAQKLRETGLELERQSQPVQRRPLCPPAKRTRKGQAK